jgi:hypothetical protein
MQPKWIEGYNLLGFHLANSCRGIIALHRNYGEPIHLYQPLTGEYILTPRGLRDIDITKSLSVVGLGYDPDRKLFKLVGVSRVVPSLLGWILFLVLISSVKGCVFCLLVEL